MVALYAAWAIRRLSPYRLAALALVFAALANPSLKDENRSPLTNIALLVVDESASQSVAARPQQTESAVAALTAALEARENTEVRIARVGDDETGRDLGTLMMAKLREAAAAEPRNRLAGAILVTDGQVHDTPALPELGVPIHVLLTGSNEDWDRRVIIKQAPSFAIVGEEIEMVLRVEDAGAVPDDMGTTAEIKVSIDGAPGFGF